jgi:hypothetical protein
MSKWKDDRASKFMSYIDSIPKIFSKYGFGMYLIGNIIITIIIIPMFILAVFFALYGDIKNDYNRIRKEIDADNE